MNVNTSLNKWILSCGRNLLLAAFLASPIVAAAALASLDVGGVTRVSPTTMGALESTGAVGAPIPAPTGLAVQRM